jgi:hypothetical protein
MSDSDQSNTFYVFDVDSNVEEGDVWTNWSPVAVVEAGDGHEAIKKVARKLGEGVAVAVPADQIVASTTRVERRTRVKVVPVSLELMAPELLPPEPEESPAAEEADE